MVTAIKGARVLSMAQGSDGRDLQWDKGTILLGDDGKVSAIGSESEIHIPEDAQVVDASGKVITPGFIDAHTHVGIGELAIGREGADYNESSDPITPQVRAIDAT